MVESDGGPEARAQENLQRRTLRTLMAGLIPAGAAMTAAYSAAAVLGEELSGSEMQTLGQNSVQINSRCLYCHPS